MNRFLRLLFLCLPLCSISAPAYAQAAPLRHEFTSLPASSEYELIGVYSLERLNKILSGELDEFMRSSTMPTDFRGRFSQAKYPVKLYRVKYRSVVPELNNRPTLASGLVAVPDTGANAMPVVSYQHGTVFGKHQVPSNPDASMETRIMIAQFAAQGYVVVAADYFGRGISDLPDSYLVKGSTQQAGSDMFFTALDMLKNLNIKTSQLFLSGWSQGGWVTMQYLKKLESLNIRVTATAIASAPVDISLTANRWFNNYQPVDAIYLPGCVALLLQAQEFYHEQLGLTESAIQPRYLQASRDLYNNIISWEEFSKLTPSKLSEFIRPEFARSGFVGGTPFWRVLENNDAYRWRTVTPLRSYYGGMDEVTPIYVGQLPENTQKLLGGAPATSVDAGTRADHRAVFIYGVIDQKKWFDALAGMN